MESREQRRLVVVEGPMEGRSYPLQDAVITMGRASDNAVVFDSSRISRHHAQIRFLPQGAVIEDLGSTNGTWVNNQHLTDVQTLASGDLIRLADYVTLRYVQEEPVRTKQTGPSLKGERTVTMGESPAYDSVPGPIFEVAYEEDHEEADVYEPVSPKQVYAPPSDAVSIDEEAPRRRSTLLYVFIGVLVLLICLCVATAVYLWFAPVEFWEKVFDWIGIPMPTAYLCALLAILGF
ncbi:MAG: FHA domain-containing protein [Anaerolineae bacterium]